MVHAVDVAKSQIVYRRNGFASTLPRWNWPYSGFSHQRNVATICFVGLLADKLARSDVSAISIGCRLVCGLVAKILPLHPEQQLFLDECARERRERPERQAERQERIRAAIESGTPLQD